MNKRVFSQQFNTFAFVKSIRRITDGVHAEKMRLKTGLSIFSSTFILGTGVVMAASQSTGAVQPSILTPNSPTFSATAEPVSTPETPTAVSTTSSDSNNSGQTNNSRSSSAHNSATTSVTVNGQSVSVPDNGSVHKTIVTDNGSTSVDIQTQSSSQNGTSSYTNLQTNTFSAGSSSITTSTIQAESGH